MSESGLLEVVFPQFRSTGETSRPRVSDASEMSNGIFLQSLVSPGAKGLKWRFFAHESVQAEFGLKL